MAYLLPAPRVQQILRSPNANLVDVDLYPTLVGPLYRVKRDVVVQPQGTISHVVGNPVLVAAYPYIDPGAVIDVDSVRVFVKEAWAIWIDSKLDKTNAAYVNNAGTYVSGFLAGLDYMVDPTRDFVTDGVKVGDRLYVDGGDGLYVVSEVQPNKLTFTSKIRKTIRDYVTGTVEVTGSGAEKLDVAGTASLWSTADIKAGLKIAFGTIDTNTVWYTIASINSATSITLVDGPAVAVAAGSTYTIRKGYEVKRYYAEFEVPALDFIATSTSVEIDVVADQTHDFTSGEIQILYRALRKDKVGLYKYASTLEVEADMENDYLNPLGFSLCHGAFAANGNTHPVLAYIISEDNDSAYIDSLADLANFKKTYILVPLTTSSAVCNSFSAHATAMSDWHISYFRVTFVSRKLITADDLVTAVASAHA